MDGDAHNVFANRGLGGGGGGVEQLEGEADALNEEADVMFPRRGCCCYFWVPRFGSGRPAPASAWETIRDEGPWAGAEAASPGGPWWRWALMRVREWSEIVAGPRWKTFIRRLNRNHRWGGGRGVGGGLCGIGGGGGGGARSGKFQYDPLSYALNFDEGHDPDGDSDGDYGYRNFCARYVLPPSPGKTSVDLGGRDAPPHFPAA